MNILTFDIEDWFHILENSSTNTSEEWAKFPSRIQSNTERILTLLETNNQKATFFCLGWIAKSHPEVIRTIAKYGHEIGCHSNMHQLVYKQSPAEFKSDIRAAICQLEDIVGVKILSYRAPGFSITKKTNWVFEILTELGIERDSSVFPAFRSHGGYLSFGTTTPIKIETNGYSIKEFPMNTVPFLRLPIAYSGGGFFRIFPAFALDLMIKRDNYVMTYFHPRDFDPDQPMVPGLSLLRKFKSYVGLNSALSKLTHWIENNKFIDLQEADKQIDWSTAKSVKLHDKV